MKNGSYFIPREQLYPFMQPRRDEQRGGPLHLLGDRPGRRAARAPATCSSCSDPQHPIAMVYVVNIREPTFAPWYMEGGLCLLCRYGEQGGVYFLNLQLSGPGAPMGLCSGREFSGLPKKICERIVVERNRRLARALIESQGPAHLRRRGGDRGIQRPAHGPDVRGTTGRGPGQRGACLLFQYEIRQGAGQATSIYTEGAAGPLRQRHRLPDVGTGPHPVARDGAVPRRPLGGDGGREAPRRRVQHQLQPGAGRLGPRASSRARRPTGLIPVPVLGPLGPLHAWRGPPTLRPVLYR